MKAAPFDYVRADSQAHLCDLLAQSDVDTRIIAGGQTLTPMMAMRILSPQRLVDINHIPELANIQQQADVVHCGAVVRQAEAQHALAQQMPLLSTALTHVGHPATRARGTLVGSLCAADPSAETALIACTLNAKVEIASARGQRSMTAQDFIVGPLETCLEDDEYVASIVWPRWPSEHQNVGYGFEEMAVRHGDFALVACAAQVALDDSGNCCRIALGIANVAVTPLIPDATNLLGTSLKDAAIRNFCEALATLMSPPSDYVANADYRRRIAVGLLLRALSGARDQADVLRRNR